MEDKEIEKIKQAWQRQAAFLDKVDLFPEKEMLEMIRRRQPSQYQCRRRDKVRTLALQLASLLLCAAAGGLAFGNGLMAWGFVAAAAGLFCLCAVVAAARDLHLLLHVHPAKYSPATVDYYLEKTCRLEALRRLRRRRLSSLLRLPAAPSPRTPRWAGAASAACLLLVVALCLWQLPQPVAPAPRAAQQLASTSAPQPAQPAALAALAAMPVSAARQPAARPTAAPVAKAMLPTDTEAAATSALASATLEARPEPLPQPMTETARLLNEENYGALYCGNDSGCDTVFVVASIAESLGEKRKNLN